MDIAEPEINREDILIVLDDEFVPRNVCLVTGAASGIGRATAVAAAANGLYAVGVDVDEQGGEQTRAIAQKMGGQMAFIRADLTRDQEIERAVRQAATIGEIKFLANIAGIQNVYPLEDFPMEKYDLMQRLMLRAPFYLSKLVIPHMRRSRNGRGAIGNMASIHAHICTLNKAVYNIVKFGLRGLTQSIAAEGDGKIRAFSVSTGFVKTPLTLNQVPAQARQRGVSEQEVVGEVMMGRSKVKEMMSPIEVANLFTFGFSRHSRYLVGGDLLFDGGVVLTY
ncbi:MAG: SDR family oxidoreductase [Thermodesulfobacteriota bacterium]